MDFIDEIVMDLENDPTIKKYLKEGRKPLNKKVKLNEDTIAQAVKDADSEEEAKDIKDAEKVVGKDAEVIEEEGDIEIALNESLEEALDNLEYTGATGKRPADFPNLLLIGEAGTGKTARVEAWAAKHNINLVVKQAAVMDETDLGGCPAVDMKAQVVRKYSTTELDNLGIENSVLFLDELNRAPGSIQGTLLTLIQNHTVADVRSKGSMKYFPTFLFTVAAINPDDMGGYDVNEIDSAMRSRFTRLTVQSSMKNWIKYYTALCEERADACLKAGKDKLANKALGRSALANALYKGGLDFGKTENSHESDLNSRTLTKALERCDGTKASLIKAWPGSVNSETLDEVKSILSNYQDVNDKANQGLMKGLKNNKAFKSVSDKAVDETDAIIKDMFGE